MWTMSEVSKCPICLDDFINPAPLPCGHYFCLACIGEYWRSQEACQCPLCLAVFPYRPPLKTHRPLDILTEKKDEDLKAGEVPCDICETKRRAVKSCLVCLASYCEAHLMPHYQNEDLGHHRLISVVKNLEDSVCGLHGKQLMRFCRSDRTCICLMCAHTEHRGHHIVSIAAEAANRKFKLKRRIVKLQQQLEATLRKTQTLKLSEGLQESCKQDNSQQLDEEISHRQKTNIDLQQLLQTQDDLLFVQLSMEDQHELRQ